MKFKPEHWIKAKKLYRLSARHIQMAKELGLNPTKFGKYANHKQQPWKLPLREYIEELYFKRFKKAAPEGFVVDPRLASESKKNFEKDKSEYTEDYLGFHEYGYLSSWYNSDFSYRNDAYKGSENTQPQKLNSGKKVSKKPGHLDRPSQDFSIDKTPEFYDDLPF